MLVVERAAGSAVMTSPGGRKKDTCPNMFAYVHICIHVYSKCNMHTV